MKIAARDIARLISAADPKFCAYLFYGPDIGLISERADKILRQFHPSGDDDFAISRLSGPELAQDKTLLSDNLNAIPMLGGTRVVILSGDGTELTDSVKLALSQMNPESRLIIQARNVNTRHALVKLCDGAPQCASVGCYPDDSHAVSELATQMLAEYQISISSEALALLTSKLGSDRQASRQEVEKLALYAAEKKQISSEDVELMLGDGASIETDALCVAILSGDVEQFSQQLARLQLEAIQPILVIRQLMGLFMVLMRARDASGQADLQALNSIRPPLHFKMKPVISRQVSLWSLAQVRDAVNKLQELELQLKSSHSASPYSLMGQNLLGLTLRARRLNHRR